MSALLFPSLRSYRRGWLRGDLIAGLTVWAVLVPEALAYASIAGVSPVVGLYAAPGALLLYAAFGSSRHLVVGPMSATAALSAATVGDLVAGGSDAFAAMTVALAICVGIVALAAGLARLGFLAAFISEPVLKGFIVGLALTILIGQVPKLLGIEKEPGDFFEQAWGVLSHLGDVHLLTLVVGLLSLALVLGLRRLAPAVPGSLVAVLGSVLAVAVLGLDDHGLDIVGDIDAGLPSFGLPDGLALHDYGDLAAGAVGVMLVGFAEGLGAAKTYAARHRYEIDADRELVGLGAANLASGLSSGMVVNGSLSKTAVNGSAGACTQLSGLVAAAMTVLTLLLLTGLFEQLPEATLAAIVIAAVVELVDLPALRRLYGTYAGRLGGFSDVTARPDFVAALAALLGVLVFDTLPGLFIGIAVSLTLLLYRASRPHVALLGAAPGVEPPQYADLERHPGNRTPAGVAIVRPESGLFFANADAAKAALLRAAAPDGIHTLVLDAESVPFIDVTAMTMLDQLAADLDRRGITLRLARERGQIRDLLRHGGADTARLHLHPTVRDAVAAARTDPTTRQERP
jgi:high affinity sulfate transporter 1